MSVMKSFSWDIAKPVPHPSLSVARDSSVRYVNIMFFTRMSKVIEISITLLPNRAYKDLKKYIMNLRITGM